MLNRNRKGTTRYLFIFFLLLYFVKPAVAAGYTDTTFIEDGLTTQQYLNYAAELQQQVNFNACFAACQKVLATDPANKKALAIIVHSYNIQQKWDSCIGFGNKVLAADENAEPQLYEDVSNAYINKKDWASAIAISKKLIHIQPGNEQAKNDINQCKRNLADRQWLTLQISLLFFAAVSLYIIFFFRSGKGDGESAVPDGRVRLPVILAAAAFAGGIFYFVFFLLAPWIRSANVILPTQQFMWFTVGYTYQHDGMEGLALYAMSLVCAFSAYGIAVVLQGIKNRSARISILLLLLAVAYLFLSKQGFIPRYRPMVT